MRRYAKAVLSAEKPSIAWRRAKAVDEATELFPMFSAVALISFTLGTVYTPLI
jgi:hypothetical protein